MNKKTIFILICLIIALALLLFLGRIHMQSLAADSGFDSSWDSGGFDFGGSDFGGSDFGGSNYGGSNYGNYSYDYGSNHSFIGSGIGSGIYILFIIAFIIFLAIKLAIENYNNRKLRIEQQNKNLSENTFAIKDILKEIPDFNIEEFKKYALNTFIEVQEAWMNFDYNKLRKLLTDELYNTYKSQLKTLELKKQKNIMEDFKKIDCVISQFEKSNKEYTIHVELKIKFYDYLVNKEGVCIRGNNFKRNVMTYNLTFVKSISKKDNKCPNCNAPLNNKTSSNKCPYCKSTIISETHDFILSKKQAISQTKEL